MTSEADKTQKAMDQPRKQLTPVERTAVQVSLFRWHAARRPGASDDEPDLFDASFDKMMLDAFPEVRDSMDADTTSRLNVGAGMMAVRTVGIDEQLLGIVNTGRNPWAAAAPAASTPQAQAQAQAHSPRPVSRQNSTGAHAPPPPIRQVIILGAGLDNRAWRLAWPPGTSVFEVDTGTVEDLKGEVFASQPLRCERRVPLVADLSLPRKLRGVLRQGGVDFSQPVVWLLEGLIGYLSPAQAHRLLWRMHHMSAPGSHFIMTAPPTVEQREVAKRNNFPLKHSTFEEPEVTLKRVHGAGWRSASLITPSQLQDKYKMECWQAQLWGVKEASGPKPKHVEMRLRCSIM
mmetsp:Transcript_14973/g.37354  ORF Transcript_14973/g.37354 Transcript_14973/m.37354 type:complete len:346 (-) Transcript_14973:1309-2346(-)